jgi:hypothetical protein
MLYMLMKTAGIDGLKPQTYVLRKQARLFWPKWAVAEDFLGGNPRLLLKLTSCSQELAFQYQITNPGNRITYYDGIT